MNSNNVKIKLKLEEAWTGIVAALAKMSQGTDVRPAHASEVFIYEENGDGVLEVTIKPAVFVLPERANNPDRNLRVVVEGRIRFAKTRAADGRAATGTFSTRVGYFRVKKMTVQHVYGAHYDFEESQMGHPVFHAQMASQAHLWDNATSSALMPIGHDDDLVSAILRNVRVPSAQMDVFSVIIQVCADHLISEDSPEEVRRAFDELRETCNFFAGAAGRLSYLNSEPAISCYRSTHWYGGTASSSFSV
jgi:hypothetical protein